eukprot:Lithocolla_globosa_v1_NODE_132_length_5923_cov_39.615883.p3 type:complete len:389 gc:universal NODE_132_length_5923_cov_39.615883:4357-3191(-)
MDDINQWLEKKMKVRDSIPKEPRIARRPEYENSMELTDSDSDDDETTQQTPQPENNNQQPTQTNHNQHQPSTPTNQLPPTTDNNQPTQTTNNQHQSAPPNTGSQTTNTNQKQTTTNNSGSSDTNPHLYTQPSDEQWQTTRTSTNPEKTRMDQVNTPNDAGRRDREGEPTTKTTNEKNYCPVCQKEASNKCGKCKTVWYDTRECQREHWTTHKKTCTRPTLNNPPGGATTAPTQMEANQPTTPPHQPEYTPPPPSTPPLPGPNWPNPITDPTEGTGTQQAVDNRYPAQEEHPLGTTQGMLPPQSNTPTSRETMPNTNTTQQNQATDTQPSKNTPLTREPSKGCYLRTQTQCPLGKQRQQQRPYTAHSAQMMYPGKTSEHTLEAAEPTNL